MQCSNCKRDWPDEFNVCPICANPLTRPGAVDDVPQQSGGVDVEHSELAIQGDLAGRDKVSAQNGSVVVTGGVQGDLTIISKSSPPAESAQPPAADQRLAYLNSLIGECCIIQSTGCLRQFGAAHFRVSLPSLACYFA